MNTLNTRRALSLNAVAIAVAALGLAACGSSKSKTSSSASTGPSSPSGAPVSLKSIGGRRVLATSSGQAVYFDDQDVGSKILCTGSCAKIWVPVSVSASSSSLGDSLGTVKRPDGTTQVTFKGHPLYTFASEGSGQLTGDGVHDSFNGQSFTWHVASKSGASSSTTAGGASAPNAASPGATSTTSSPSGSSGGGSGGSSSGGKSSGGGGGYAY
jgi:predicted lipoprotein with Yx(FWY)xxD motif